MGLATFAAAATASAPNLAALQSTQDLVWVMRMRVDSLLGIASGGAIAYGSIDDGTNANAKCYLKANDIGAGVSKQIQLVIPGQVAFGPTAANALWGNPGRFIVALLWHLSSTNIDGYAIYDDTGTNTLLDGLPRGSSVFFSSVGRAAPFPNIALNGAVRLNVAASGATVQQFLDGTYFLNALPALGSEDAIPTAATPGLIEGWNFSDPVGASTYANLLGGGPVLTPSGTVTISRGGGAKWGPVGKPPAQPHLGFRGMREAVHRSYYW